MATKQDTDTWMEAATTYVHSSGAVAAVPQERALSAAAAATAPAFWSKSGLTGAGSRRKATGGKARQRPQQERTQPDQGAAGPEAPKGKRQQLEHLSEKERAERNKAQRKKALEARRRNMEERKAQQAAEEATAQSTAMLATGSQAKPSDGSQIPSLQLQVAGADSSTVKPHTQHEVAQRGRQQLSLPLLGPASRQNCPSTTLQGATWHVWAREHLDPATTPAPLQDTDDTLAALGGLHNDIGPAWLEAACMVETQLVTAAAAAAGGGGRSPAAATAAAGTATARLRAGDGHDRRATGRLRLPGGTDAVPLHRLTVSQATQLKDWPASERRVGLIT
ncbi:hypothetical protein PLESTF_001064600 [Pleodorina starrii]|nr:hypothetical protein PLESTF_001064600 [Pleodorina starrii]